MSDAAAAFWRFSLAIYARPDVPPACLVLQDQHDRDVNVMLFCCWLGASGRGRLDRAALDAADRAVSGWRHDVVEHFRAARRAIKAAALPDSDGIYAKAKAVELDAERLLQRQLAGRAPAENAGSSTEKRLGDALANLTLYLGDAPAAPIVGALKAMAETDFATAPA
ncbi:MAG TPA: TIGR02444 family protein [Stellaceae bacterium]|nr:TIGR02444 family protein [Stellaceae bacterium]